MDADIGIVGGGPAGAWAGCRLAREGARVVLFDHSHPREKPCGGGLTGRALALVGDAVPAAALGVRAVAVAHAVFLAPGTKAATIPLVDAGISTNSSLVVADRRTFDQAMLDAACAAGVAHVAERVRQVTTDEAAVTVETTARRWRVGFLVGADGANSLVRRRVARPFARTQLSIATGYFAHDVTSRDIVVEFVARPSGYIWSFPRHDHLAIGICAQADATTPAELRARLDAWVAGFGAARGARLERYAWPIPSLGPGDWRHECPAGDRWALVGDAAGLVDPITREGIFFALQSADLLVRELLDSPASAGAAYVRALRREIVPELQRAARLEQGFFRGAFTRLLVDSLRHSRAVRAVMADLVAGRQPYATLKRRLIATLEVGLAWRLLLLELRGAAGGHRG